MKPIYEKTYKVRDCDVDRYGYLTPARILFFAQDVAGSHCTDLSLDYETLAQKRLFWAVIRHRVQISRYPKTGETITVQTWPMPTTRSAYPRSTVAYDENGNELFRAISLWVLMDLESRAMILPGKSGIEVNGMLTGSELAAPGSMALIPAPNSTVREVVFSDLDRNGHMNNCRYLQWVADLLPSAFHKTSRAKEFTVCYLSEAREGQKLRLNWMLSDGPQLSVDALREGDAASAGQGRVFSVRMLF